MMILINNLIMHMDRTRTPWPIELNTHPGFKGKKTVAPTERLDNNPNKELTPERLEEIATESFKNPKEARETILEHARVKPIENFDGGNVFYMWLNKSCPVGCEFCFFRSPAKEKKSPDTEITDEGIDKLVQFSLDGTLDKFVVSGGGEPFQKRKKVYELAKRIKTDLFVIVTSGFWSRTESSTNHCLSELLENAKQNPYQPTTVVRLSLDQGHLEKLSKGEGFRYVKNIIDWFSKNAPDDPKFKFLIHTMEGDKTVEELLAELEIAEKVDKGEHLTRSSQVRLKNGLKFGIEYSQIFDSNPHVDIHDAERVGQNNQTFRDFITYRRKGNMSIQFHGDDPKGVYYLLLYDGTTIIWGATSPDIETSIYEDGYQQMMKKNVDDVLTLANLEKGPCHMQDIVSEVNPTAVSRAVGVGLRDFYARLLWEEDTTRLYASVRVLQEYVAEGRIKNDEIQKWPQQLQALVSLDKEKLQKVCLESPYTIVQQYLADPNVSAEKLTALYRLVALGHYAMTPEKMRELVAAAEIDEGIKKIFKEAIEVRSHVKATEETDFQID